LVGHLTFAKLVAELRGPFSATASQTVFGIERGFFSLALSQKDRLPGVGGRDEIPCQPLPLPFAAEIGACTSVLFFTVCSLLCVCFLAFLI
jgi:hypothetical protein